MPWVTRARTSGSLARSITPKHQLALVCAVYLTLSGVYGSVNLDVDEFSFVREPYEMVGGDYTKRYLTKHEVGNAAVTALKSYYFYWKYRPLFSPIIDEKDKDLFHREETRFGYKKPVSVQRATDPDRIAKYAQRLVVPEPDRFYRNGAGKPLLPAILSIPQLGLTQLVSSGDRNLLVIQHTYNYHPMFILVRLAQILSGLFTILVVYWILAREYDQTKAVLGAAIMAFFPLSIKYFPNLHHDAFLAPFALLAAYWFTKQQYLRAGIFFGLALASKNAAIFLAPALLGYVIWEVLDARKNDPGRSLFAASRQGMRGWATAMLVGFVVLAPFANPISYVSEILTPITHRPYDPRGEDVNARTAAEEIILPPPSTDSEARLPIGAQTRRAANQSGFWLRGHWIPVHRHRRGYAVLSPQRATSANVLAGCDALGALWARLRKSPYLQGTHVRALLCDLGCRCRSQATTARPRGCASAHRSGVLP